MSDQKPLYRGRFAPSPTGPLHFGSLIAALASYLEALSQQGEWLVRMEDVDVLRNVRHADSDILKTLEAYGFEWQDEVIYQTRRTQAYQEALHQLTAKDLIYRCICSRRQLRQQAEHGPLGIIYPGTCQNSDHPEHHEHAVRLRTRNQHIEFVDAIMGSYGHNPHTSLGDFIVRRRDGLFAYQLAVVVDDAWQGITHIVRGFDLLESTPRQIYLQQCLDYPACQYAHLPLAVNAQGDKLSKQTHAAAIDIKNPVATLLKVMKFLHQQPPEELAQASLHEFWQWAKGHWTLSRVPSRAKIPFID
ncbi:MAG: tRNA glutamyl-Q(34) synthetase GluQRS [Gammaproteobacteria bacterium]